MQLSDGDVLSRWPPSCRRAATRHAPSPFQPARRPPSAGWTPTVLQASGHAPTWHASWGAHTAVLAFLHALSTDAVRSGNDIQSRLVELTHCISVACMQDSFPSTLWEQASLVLCVLLVPDLSPYAAAVPAGHAATGSISRWLPSQAWLPSRWLPTPRLPARRSTPAIDAVLQDCFAPVREAALQRHLSPALLGCLAMLPIFGTRGFHAMLLHFLSMMSGTPPTTLKQAGPNIIEISRMSLCNTLSSAL